MIDFLLATTFFVVVMVAVGLFCVLRGKSNADRMMAVQLFGTGGIAALLLLGAASGTEGVIDVVLTLAVLAAFAAVAFVKADEPSTPDDAGKDQRP
jgi:multicomponent Na+:H+ antiporter subunit F